MPLGERSTRRKGVEYFTGITGTREVFLNSEHLG